MNKCPSCGHPNESFFKFCLKCGADLGAAQAIKPTSIGARPTTASDPAKRLASLAQRPRPTPAAEPPKAAEPAKPESVAPPEPAAVEVPSAKTEMVSPESLLDAWESAASKKVDRAAFEPAVVARTPAPALSALTPAPAVSAPTPAPEKPASGPRCPSCSAIYVPGHLFCAECGHRFPAASASPVVQLAAVGAQPVRVPDTMPEIAAPEPAAIGSTFTYAPSPSRMRTRSKVKLVVLNEDGSDGETLSLFDGANVLGKKNCDLAFPSDIYLSDQHAEVNVTGSRVTVRDAGSMNGTFVRITEPVRIESGDLFRVGQELLRYEDIDRAMTMTPAPDDGTELLGAPVGEGVFGRLVQIMTPTLDGNAWLLRGRFITLGRERGDIRFLGDGYVSGRHASLTRKPEGLFLEDLDSSNGTYVRVKGEMQVVDGDLILLGQQLFRIAS